MIEELQTANDNLRVVFIAAIGHSGSTMLELILGSSEYCMGLGEVFQLIHPNSTVYNALADDQCTCTAPILQCDFWSKAIPDLQDKSRKPTEKYKSLIEHFRTHFPGAIMVDSSKTAQALEVLADVPGIDLRVIHLVRDVRAWTVARQESFSRRKGYQLSQLLKKRGVKGFVRYLQCNRFYSFYDWHKTQRRLEAVFKKKQLKVFHLSYEQLCLQTKMSIEALCDFTGITYKEQMLSMTSSNSHNLFGNRMRFQPHKRSQITYDNRWFYRSDWMLPSLLFPWVMAYNRDVVYAAQRRVNWD